MFIIVYLIFIYFVAVYMLCIYLFFIFFHFRERTLDYIICISPYCRCFNTGEMNAFISQMIFLITVRVVDGDFGHHVTVT